MSNLNRPALVSAPLTEADLPKQHYGHGALHDLQHSDAPSYFPGGHPIAGEECADVEPAKRPMSRLDGAEAVGLWLASGVVAILVLLGLVNFAARWLP